MRRRDACLRWSLLAFGVLSWSCVQGLPLPVSTIQFLDGSWPARPERGPQARPYTIKGDRLEFPEIGFGLTRPNQADWEFRVGNDVINVLRRQPLREGGLVPRVITQVVPRPPTFDADAYLEQELGERARESGAILLETGLVDQTEARIWTMDLPADKQNPAERIRRYYLFRPSTITLIDCRAELVDFAAVLPDFVKIVNTVTLPAEQDLSPSPVPGLSLGDASRTLTLPLFDLSMLLPGPWDFLVDGQALNVFYAGTIDEGEVLPVLSVAVTAIGEGFDLKAYEEALRKELEKGAVTGITTEPAVIGGVAATRFTVTREDPQSRQQVVNQAWLCVQPNRVVTLQFAASPRRFEALSGDLTRLLDSLKLSKVALPSSAAP